MTRKRNGFLIFCLSLIPGVGEMCMGFMKMGISLMSCFFLTLMLADAGLWSFTLYISIIVWFYSFFHVHNLAGLPDETFYEVKDTYLFPFAGQENENAMITGKYRKAVAVILIVIGAGSLLKSLFYMIRSYLPEIVNDFVFYDLPRVTVSIAVIALGIYMICGKKKQFEAEQEQSQ